MNKHVIINSTPPFAFYDASKPANYELAFPQLLSISDFIKELAIEGGEVANMTVSIDNVQGGLTSYLNGWFNKECAYYLNNSLQFTGKISTIQSGDTISLTVIM